MRDGEANLMLKCSEIVKAEKNEVDNKAQLSW